MSEIDIDAAIGKLTITAVGIDGSTRTLTIYTIDDYPQNVEAPILPALFPHPTNWLGASKMTPKFWDSSVGVPVQNDYTMQYMFLYSQVGEDRGVYVFYKPAALMLKALREAIIKLDVFMTHFSVSCTPLASQTEKISGKNFFGCIITVKAITEAII